MLEFVERTKRTSKRHSQVHVDIRVNGIAVGTCKLRCFVDKHNQDKFTYVGWVGSKDLPSKVHSEASSLIRRMYERGLKKRFVIY